MITIDLPAAAHREYDRRRRAWIATRDAAANGDDRGRIIRSANADLLNWQDIVIFVELGAIPDDSRRMARSARKTLETMKESGRATNDQIRDLFALTRHLERHAQLRHGHNAAQPERKAA